LLRDLSVPVLFFGDCCRSFADRFLIRSFSYPVDRSPSVEGFFCSGELRGSLAGEQAALSRHFPLSQPMIEFFERMQGAERFFHRRSLWTLKTDFAVVALLSFDGSLHSEEWGIGVMEYWDRRNKRSAHGLIAMRSKSPYLPITPLLQYSITPIFDSWTSRSR
jgi:hypothetical protein